MEEDFEDEQDHATRKKRFSKAQVACLNSFYNQGMTGASRENAPLIVQASEDTHLTTAQIKVSY